MFVFFAYKFYFRQYRRIATVKNNITYFLLDSHQFVLIQSYHFTRIICHTNIQVATCIIGKCVCLKTMGNVGVALAMIGVVICPITSGDTAFRSARLTLADWLKIDQDSYANRLKLCIPVLGVGAFLGIGNALGFINYTVIWRYFSWTNQTLAMIVLWAASMYLFKEKKNYWITAVPATFMSAVSCTYFVLAPECLGGLLNSKTAEGATIYNTAVAYPVGIVFAVAMLALFIHATKKAGVRNAA